MPVRGTLAAAIIPAGTRSSTAFAVTTTIAVASCASACPTWKPLLRACHERALRHSSSWDCDKHGGVCGCRHVAWVVVQLYCNR